MSNTLSAKDLKFVLHIEGREAVELEGYEAGNQDQILVDAAFMKMVRAVHSLTSQRDSLLSLVKRYRNETPLGHQPHMIAIEADVLIAKCEDQP